MGVDFGWAGCSVGTVTPYFTRRSASTHYVTRQGFCTRLARDNGNHVTRAKPQAFPWTSRTQHNERYFTMQTVNKSQVVAAGIHLGSDQSETVKRGFYDALAAFLNGATGTDRTSKVDAVRTAIINRVAVDKGNTDGVKLASVSTMSKFAAYAVRFAGLDADVSLEVAARAASAGGAKDDAEAVAMAQAFKAECQAADVAYSIRNARDKWPTDGGSKATATADLGTVSMDDVAAWMLSQANHVSQWAIDNAATAFSLVEVLTAKLDKSQPDAA